MKLKTRLIITFLSLLIIPTVITSVLMLGITIHHTKMLENKYDVESKRLSSISDQLTLFNEMTQEIYNELKNALNVSPFDEDNIEYLSDINKRLSEKSSYMIVKKNDETIFGDTDNIPKEVKELSRQNLICYYNIDNDLGNAVFISYPKEMLIKCIKFSFDDKADGKLYIITDLTGNIIDIEVYFIIMIITFLICLIATAVAAGVNLYMAVSVPLYRIKGAAQCIQDGNLDFSLESDKKDELSDLCNDFELMRERLKLQAEEKIKYDSESKELISNITHDLKTPITAVKGYVEGIIDGVADTPEKMEKYLKTIYNKSNEMDRLINELTFYSKIDTNRIPYTFTKLNVTNYFNDCIEEVGLDLESKNMELAYFNYTSADIEIIGDAEQLKKVVNNIVGNSIKYMDKTKGYINIRIKDIGDFIQVEIEDNGKGIAEKDLPYIFDRFYRTDTSRNSAKGGSGIGLSIVKKIIEDHGGRIWATSKEATGTVMYFVLRKYQEVQIYE